MYLIEPPHDEVDERKEARRGVGIRRVPENTNGEKSIGR
jgi:hypothetical protein